MTPRKKKEKKDNIYLSVVLPAYKAESFIEKNLLILRGVLESLNVSYEIICVVDGQVDCTREEVLKVSNKYGNIKIVGYLTNLGKGHAVRYGMAKARGKIIGFIDSDLGVDPSAIPLMLEHLKWYDADVIIGSKRHLASKVNYPFQRRVISVGFQMLGKALFGFKIKDTQVGVKFFRREVLKKVLPRLLVKRYAFDVEILAVSYYLGFKKIYEAPVELRYNFKELVHASTLRTIFLMFWDTAAVFYRLRILRFYDSKNKKNWITPDYLTLNNKK